MNVSLKKTPYFFCRLKIINCNRKHFMKMFVLQAKVLRMLAAVQKSFGQDSDLQETTLKLQQLQADYRLKLEDELTDEETDKESIDETDDDGHNSLSDLTSSGYSPFVFFFLFHYKNIMYFSY